MEIEVDPHLGTCIIIIETIRHMIEFFPDVEYTHVIHELIRVHEEIMHEFVRKRHIGTETLERVFDECMRIKNRYSQNNEE